MRESFGPRWLLERQRITNWIYGDLTYPVSRKWKECNGFVFLLLEQKICMPNEFKEYEASKGLARRLSFQGQILVKTEWFKQNYWTVAGESWAALCILTGHGIIYWLLHLPPNRDFISDLISSATVLELCFCQYKQPFKLLIFAHWKTLKGILTFKG